MCPQTSCSTLPPRVICANSPGSRDSGGSCCGSQQVRSKHAGANPAGDTWKVIVALDLGTQVADRGGRAGREGWGTCFCQPRITGHSQTQADPLEKQGTHMTHRAVQGCGAVPGSCRVGSSQKRPSTVPPSRWCSAKGWAPLASAEWSAGQPQQELGRKHKARQGASLDRSCCRQHLPGGSQSPPPLSTFRPASFGLQHGPLPLNQGQD